jgi:glutathione reductase (NADPH)
MSKYDYDLFVIGAGSGGVRAARMSAQYGARVAVAEERYLGGTCVNAGCIPKKLFVYAAHFRDDLEDAEAYGWSVGAREIDWKRLVANKDREIARLNEVYRTLLEDAGVRIIEGRARLLDGHTVAVGNERYRAEYVVIACGGWPHLPSTPGVEHTITSNEAFHLPSLPRRILIVGGGYVAVEFASIFHGLGVAVTLLHRGPLFLRGFDDDLRSVLAEEMSKRGIELRFEELVTRIERTNDTLRAEMESGGEIETDAIMCATGRAPNTSNLGLEAAGVELDERKAVVVDAYSRSTVPNVFAIGDCTDRRALTPVAIAEGQALAETLFNRNPTMPSYLNVPSAVFSNPSIGTVGLTEGEARRKYGSVDVYKSSFRPLKHTLTGRDERTFMKLVVERDSQCVVGCHMVGPDAGEIIQGFAVAVNCGATKGHFDSTVGIHPTAAEEFVTMRRKAVEV